MSDRPEAIDQRLVRALAHPLRVQILEVLTERVASPTWLAEHLDSSLSDVAYHTRALDRCGCLDLIDTAQRRGATEHFYKAAPGSFLGSRIWRKVPRTVRGGFSGASLQTFLDKAVDALEAGTLDGRDETIFTWMPMLLDERGWEEITAIMEETTDRVLEAQRRSNGRLARLKGWKRAISAVVAVASFETGAAAPG
jgi:DNA-binding transcriptional ArsR family regulator